MNTNEIVIWNFLKSQGFTDAGAAGLMGNLYAESALNPTNLQGAYEKSLNFTDESYTKAVNSGAYTNFVHDKAGYGLAQWTYWSRKQNLLNYAKRYKKSIGDLLMQLDFLYQELSTSYIDLLKLLKTTSSVIEASNAVLFNFEQPRDQSEKVQKKRYDFSMYYYSQYATKPEEDKEEEEMTQEQFNQMMDNWLAARGQMPPQSWSKDSRNWAERNGLIKGDKDGNEMYEKFMTREELIEVLYRALTRPILP